MAVKLLHSSWAGFALLLLPQVWKCLLRSSQGGASLELGAEKFCQVQCWTHVSGPTLPTLCGTALHHTRRTCCFGFWLPCAAFQHRHALSVCVTEENSLDIVGLLPVKKIRCFLEGFCPPLDAECRVILSWIITNPILHIKWFGLLNRLCKNQMTCQNHRLQHLQYFSLVSNPLWLCLSKNITWKSCRLETLQTHKTIF